MMLSLCTNLEESDTILSCKVGNGYDEMRRAAN